MGEFVDATFSGTSVVLIQQGLKTQTRRVADKLRVRVPVGIGSDLPDIIPDAGISRGTYRAELNPQGAVFAIDKEGKRFGLKPGEFQFVCPWIPRGETVLASGGNALSPYWMVTPKDGPQRVRVLETWRTHERPSDAVDGVLFAADDAFVRIENTAEAATAWVVAHSNGKHKDQWRSPRFMPRWAVRHELAISLARLVRLQNITREDAIAEGVTFTDYGKHEHTISADGGVTWGKTYTQRAGWNFGPTTSHEQCLGSPLQAFGNGWNRLHAGENWNLKDGPSPWDQNPWVWAYTFARVR
jgi:hypothetical protein